VKPLINLIKIRVPFRFDKTYKNAFEKLRESLISDKILQYYNPELLVQVKINTSDRVVAGVLSQLYSEKWYPVVYFSKTIFSAEFNYEVHNKKMLAIVKSLKE
jgi:hypothetical protein